MHHSLGARNIRCNSSAEQSGPTSSKIKRHRHSTVLEWHEPAGVVSYIDLDRLEERIQHGYVVDVSETIIYRGAVNSANREALQQRCDTVADDARLHDVRVDVDGIEPSRHVHHVLSFLTEGARNRGVLLGGKTTLADGVRLISVPPIFGSTYSRVLPAAAVAAAAAPVAAASGMVITELRTES